jgi:hypothetical protein
VLALPFLRRGLEVRQEVEREHRPLRHRQMPPAQVRRDDEDAREPLEPPVLTSAA